MGENQTWSHAKNNEQPGHRGSMLSVFIICYLESIVVRKWVWPENTTIADPDQSYAPSRRDTEHRQPQHNLQHEHFNILVLGHWLDMVYLPPGGIL